MSQEKQQMSFYFFTQRNILLLSELFLLKDVIGETNNARKRLKNETFVGHFRNYGDSGPWCTISGGQAMERERI